MRKTYILYTKLEYQVHISFYYRLLLGNKSELSSEMPRKG